ncbi:zinc finger protein RFP [Esox lucius]|uniref:Tripartite motif containing 107 n=2 Tax=Esox lucius TaxID=8010 RepID=A0A3P8Y3A0_ESOLU|nr:zinc finger protein RFP [Esox lucius]
MQEEPDTACMSLSEIEGPLVLDLSCPICLQLFSDPVSLPCGHLYCSACLRKYMGTDTTRCCCPECQAEYQGPQALLKNFKMCSIIQSYKATTAGNGSSSTEGDGVHGQQGVGPADHSDNVTSGLPLDREEQEPPQTGLIDTPVEPLVSQKKELVDAKTREETAKTREETAKTREETAKTREETAIMEKSKLLLGSQVSELKARLQVADDQLQREEERESEVRAENALLRGKASRLLEQMTELTINYVTGMRELIEAELRPGEESLSSRVRQASEVRERLKEAQLQAESLLTERDSGLFSQKLRQVQPCIRELIDRQPLDELDDKTGLEPKGNSGRVCDELERRTAELSEGLGAAQRSLRNVLNPSEVTFDVDTAHPCLALSDNLKTVTFSPKKLPYPDLPTRFSSFLQVLSTQSFFRGEHRWEVDLDGCSPWIIGVCYSRALARSGLASALESSRSSWCLMWFDNLLSSFEQGHAVPLKRTPLVRRLEITLNFRTQRLSFYNISQCSGKTHVYTFKANLTEPVHLAYRMMSGQPKARITVCS